MKHKISVSACVAMALLACNVAHAASKSKDIAATNLDIPFNTQAEALPPRFQGNNLNALLNHIEKTVPKRNKDLFESKAQYSERLNKTLAASLPNLPAGNVAIVARNFPARVTAVLSRVATSLFQSVRAMTQKSSISMSISWA